MMIDIRYHLGSLVAVFLALGLGILIGAVAFQDQLVVRQEDFIAALEARFAQLENDKSALETQVEHLSGQLVQTEEFIGRFLPRLVNGRLDGVAVVVFERKEEEQGHPWVGELVEAAGGLYAGSVDINELLADNKRELEEILLDEVSLDPKTTAFIVLLENEAQEKRDWSGLLPVMRSLAQREFRIVAADIGNDVGAAKVLEENGFPLVKDVNSPIGRFNLVEAVAP